MKKYTIQIAVYTFTTVIKAKNKKEARQKAEERYINEGRDEREITIWETK